MPDDAEADPSYTRREFFRKLTGRHWHGEPGGCTDNDCPCYINGYADGYEDGRQDEAEKPCEPVRDESRD